MQIRASPCVPVNTGHSVSAKKYVILVPKRPDRKPRSGHFASLQLAEKFLTPPGLLASPLPRLSVELPV
jgi:hypothetical protein